MGERDLSAALRVMKAKHDAGFAFVTMVSQDPNSVGKAGVDEVVDGKTPQGLPYDWSKAGRAGQVRRR